VTDGEGLPVAAVDGQALAPPRAGRSPEPVALRTLVSLSGASLAAALLFWSPLLLGGSLHGHDWSTHHFHYFDWVRTSFVEHATLPLFMADAWVTQNFIANAEAPTLGPLAWLLFLLPTGAYVKLLIVVFTAAGLAGGWLLLRDLGASSAVASLGCVLYAWSGFFASHVAVGHHWALGADLLPVLLFLYRRAALGSDGALVLAAALDALTIMGGQHQPFLWQNLVLAGFAALWALRVRAAFPLLRFALLLLLCVGFGSVKLVPLGLEFADYAPTARIQGLPAGSLLASLAGGGQGPDRVDPRIAFEHGAGWWEYAFYVGPLGLLCLVVGLAAARGCWPLIAIGVCFAVLALEPLRVWPWLAELPVWRSQRAPSRFLLLALFALLAAASGGLERLRRWAAARRPRATAALAWGLVLASGTDLWIESLAWQRAALGAPIESRQHRPQPEVLRSPDAVAELASFAPNRLTYRVKAVRGTRVLLPLGFGHAAAEWEVEGGRAHDVRGWLAVDVAAGDHELRLRYRPPGFRTGLGISTLSVLAAAGWLLWRRWSPRLR